MTDHTLPVVLLAAVSGHASPASVQFLLALQSDYGFFGPIIETLRGIGVAAAGVGLTVSILVKGAAATNGDRHALAARIAQNVFAGLFLVLLGWIIYDRIVEWTPL